MKAPKAQKYLNKEEAKIYDDICKHLEDHNALEDVDSYGLSMAAAWLWLFHEAHDKISERGATQLSPKGYNQITGELTVMKTASTMFKDLSAKFGLSNKDRELMLKFKAKKAEGDKLDDI
jgi:P27 family predicted phage terminase small subunit